MPFASRENADRPEIPARGADRGTDRWLKRRVRKFLLVTSIVEEGDHNIVAEVVEAPPPHEILWGHRLVDVMGWTDDGSRIIDYRRFHDIVVRNCARGGSTVDAHAVTRRCHRRSA
jgi:hypothetical protein